MDWEKHDDLSTLFILCAEEGRTICKRDYSYTTYEQARKDFDLMAAAPDLYEALQSALDELKQFYLHNSAEDGAIIGQIKAALAKADGVKTETI